MKRTIVFLLALCSVSLFGQRKWNIEVEGGYAYDVNTSDFSLTSFNMNGYLIGATFNYDIIKGFGIGVGAQFTNTYAKYTIDKGPYKYRKDMVGYISNYGDIYEDAISYALQIPIKIYYEFAFANDVRWKLLTGPQLVASWNNSTISSIAPDFSNMSILSYRWNEFARPVYVRWGLGTEVSYKSVYVGVDYYFGLYNRLNQSDENKQILTMSYPTWGRAAHFDNKKLNSSQLSVRVGYRF